MEKFEKGVMLTAKMIFFGYIYEDTFNMCYTDVLRHDKL